MRPVWNGRPPKQEAARQTQREPRQARGQEHSRVLRSHSAELSVLQISVRAKHPRVVSGCMNFARFFFVCRT
jgi:hypothetical protein